MYIRTQNRASHSIMSQNPTLINGFEDVMTFIKQQEHRIKELKAENEKFGEEIKSFQEETAKLEAKIFHLQSSEEGLEEENKKLKEKAKVPDGVMRAFSGLCSNWWEDELQYYQENFDIKEKYHHDPNNIPTKYLSDCNYTHLRILDDWLKEGKYDKYELEESEEESE